MPPSLGELDVVRVRLEYPDSPSADPLHGGVHVGALGQARDLGGRSSHARGRDPGLDACRIFKNDLNFIHFELAYFIFVTHDDDQVKKASDLEVRLTTRLGPSVVGNCSAHFS